MQGTLEILKKNLKENSLSYKLQQTLNFFLLQGRLNVRAGPILTLTWEDFRWIEENDAPLQTDKHKTGSYYTVHIQIEKDQREFQKRQKEAFVREVGEQPKFIFASHKNKEERSICRYLREVIFRLVILPPQTNKYFHSIFISIFSRSSSLCSMTIPVLCDSMLTLSESIGNVVGKLLERTLGTA